MFIAHEIAVDTPDGHLADPETRANLDMTKRNRLDVAARVRVEDAITRHS